MNTTLDQPHDIPVTGPIGMAGPIPVIPPRNTRMRRVVDHARQLTSDSTPMLLRGEFGVGKRTLAGMIHQWGSSPHSPYISVAAAADSSPSPREAGERLRRSESGGTLVFEEIGEFTRAQQDEILALITANDAGTDPKEMLPLMVKIVATSSQDLSTAVRKGDFCGELLSLLMDESLYLPPLRERPEDIVNLSEQMLAHFGGAYHRPGLALEPEAKLALVRHVWPGNIPELRNAIERVVLTARKSHIGEAEFHLRSASDSGSHHARDYLSLDAMEKQHILRVIRAAPTLEEAARILHVDVTTLWRKRRRYGV